MDNGLLNQLNTALNWHCICSASCSTLLAVVME